MKKDRLFEPWRLGDLELKNRIVMPAMHLNMCDDYRVTERLLAFYAERAVGGVGLINVGYASIDQRSAHPGHIGLHSDAFLPGLRQLARTLRDGGARGAVQLNHSGRYNHSMLTGGLEPVAPSVVPCRMTGETPREMTAEEISACIEAFAAAASRVAEAGFDAVEILAGTGYLISSFLSPLTNLRCDEWGGDFAGRARFGVEVVKAVRRASILPVLVRLNGNDFMQGGIGHAEMIAFARLLEAAGVDGFSINVGWHEAQMPQIVTKVPRGAFAYLARSVREAVGVPVIAGHRINDAATARQLLREKWCDAVAMGRALIADPELPNKARDGREGETVHCVACGQGCFDNLFRLRHVECLCNPRVGYERERKVAKATKREKVMVVGGGAAGMQAALMATAAGHDVSLFEQAPQLGGQLRLAGAPPGRKEFAVMADDLVRQLKIAGVRTVLDCRVDTELLEREKPDRVVLASGGVPAVPPIPGADLPHVVQAWDLLAGKAIAGQRVVVIGGGAVGIETALLLAEEGSLPAETLKFLLVHGAETPERLKRLATRGSREVTVVELLDKLGGNFGRTTRWTMLQDLERCAVACRTGVRVTRIVPEGVMVAGESGEELLPADHVVLAVGTLPEQPLRTTLDKLGIPCRVVGDAKRPAMVFDAMHQGYLAGTGLE